MCIFIYIVYMSGASRDQKRYLDLVQIELWTAMSHRVCGTKPSTAGATNTLNY